MSDPAKYLIHNTTRDVRTRTLRAEAPAHSNTVIFLAGGELRVLRKRPLSITESLFQRIHAELVQKEKHGQVKVTDLRGSRISLGTLEVVELTPTPAITTPNPKLDSAADDVNGGDKIPLHGDPKAVSVTGVAPLPQLGGGGLPGDDEEEGESNPDGTFTTPDELNPDAPEATGLDAGAPDGETHTADLEPGAPGLELGTPAGDFEVPSPDAVALTPAPEETQVQVDATTAQVEDHSVIETPEAPAEVEEPAAPAEEEAPVEEAAEEPAIEEEVAAPAAAEAPKPQAQSSSKSNKNKGRR